MTVSLNTTSVDSSLPSYSMTLLSPIYIIPGVATISMICLTCLSLPLILYNFKTSDILRRLSVRAKRPYSFYLIIGVFYLVLSILSYAFGFFIGALIIWLTDHQNGMYIKYMLLNINYGCLFYSLFMYGALAISIGLLMSTFLKTITSIQIIGMTIVLFSVFLGGAGIPLQLISMYSKNNDNSGYKLFSLWSLTYFSPFRYTTNLLLESVTQGPVFNCGKITPDQWNTGLVQDLIHAGKFDSLEDYLSMHLGYSSIFDVKHPFITNLMPIPFFDMNFDMAGQINLPFGINIPYQANMHINDWYLKQCSGDFSIGGYDVVDAWRFGPAIYAFYWSGDANILSGLIPPTIPVQIQSINVFTFDYEADKIINLILPVVLSASFISLSTAFYKKKILNFR
ncbi:MAG: hypothetical protein LBM72_00790 [Mycoplasmataceae bacterium]|nr:hypothetical protein [Mycoplasmataceae bacterium]